MNIKIVRGYGNKEAAKVFSESERERNKIWEKRILREEEDMLINK